MTVIKSEFICSIVYFFSTVFVYQIAVQLPVLNLRDVWWALVKAVLSGSIFFFGSLVTVTIIGIGDREWLTAPAWVGVRGVANGVILMIALTFGILM